MGKQISLEVDKNLKEKSENFINKKTKRKEKWKAITKNIF